MVDLYSVEPVSMKEDLLCVYESLLAYHQLWTETDLALVDILSYFFLAGFWVLS